MKLLIVFGIWILQELIIATIKNFTTTVIEPTEAIKSDNTNEQQTLLNSDKDYVHLINDEAVSFKYKIPSSTQNTESSYFLISGGYYHSLENITGKANFNELMKFKKQGAFDRFSREKYKEAQDVAAVLTKMNK